MSWNWGDGQSSNQLFPATHTYARAGTYVIAIRVLQSDALATSKSISITVQENPFLQNPTVQWQGLSAATELAMVLAAILLVAIIASFALMRFKRKKLSKWPSRIPRFRATD
jgi:hypothetical protein